MIVKSLADMHSLNELSGRYILYACPFWIKTTIDEFIMWYNWGKYRQTGSGIKLKSLESWWTAVGAETESRRGVAVSWLMCILFYQQDQVCLLKLMFPTACRVTATVQAVLKARQTCSSSVGGKHTVLVCLADRWKCWGDCGFPHVM